MTVCILQVNCVTSNSQSLLGFSGFHQYLLLKLTLALIDLNFGSAKVERDNLGVS